MYMFYIVKLMLGSVLWGKTSSQTALNKSCSVMLPISTYLVEYDLP